METEKGLQGVGHAPSRKRQSLRTALIGASNSRADLPTILRFVLLPSLLIANLLSPVHPLVPPLLLRIPDPRSFFQA